MRSWMWATKAVFMGALCSVLFSVVAHSQAFTVAVQPAQLTIFPGQQNIALTITTTSSTYSGPLDITLTGLPSGITIAPLTINAGASGTLKMSASVAAGQEGFSIYLGAPNSWTASVNVVAAAGPIQATAPLALTISLSNPAFVPNSSDINLPIMKIDTAGVAVTSKVTDVPGTISINSADGSTTFLPNASDSDNSLTMHLHGNTTVLAPKKPYKIKLGTSIDLLTAMGVTCPYVAKGKPVCDKSKSYILLANYDDKTFIRDWAASALANAIPIGKGYLDSPAGSPTPSGTDTLMPWAPHSVFVELFLNGEYEGNYQLIEEVKVDSHRVNINELAETDNSGDISGGYLLEFNIRKDDDYDFTTSQGLIVGLDDPDYLPEVPEQTSYITNYVDTAENALFSSNFTDPVLGWRAYFDEASAVNFYLVNSIMGNPDAEDFATSDYFYKDKDNPLIYMGPVWDFDTSCGNTTYSASSDPFSPQMQLRAPWYTQWFKDPAFAADVAKQWNALKSNGILTTWLSSIQSEANAQQQAQANNIGRWPMQGILVFPNSEAAGSYDGEVSFMLNWIKARIATLDSMFNSKAATQTVLSPVTGAIRQGVPVTLTAKVSGGSSPTGIVTFTVSGLVIGSAPINNGTATVAAGLPHLGDNRVYAWYQGDDHNAISRSALDFTAVAPQTPTFTSVAGPTSTNGSSLTFSAAVLATDGKLIPTGSISLSLDGVLASTAELDAAGNATFSTSPLGEGSHSLSANYGGDANFIASTSNLRNFLIKTPGMLTLSASSLTFGNQDVTTSSSAQKITVSNTGAGTINLVSITQTGDFSQTNTCGPTIAPGSNCVINAVFAPTQTGALTGTITITDDAPGSPQVVSLTGTATAPGIAIVPATGGSDTATVSAGQTASYSLVINASPGFNGSVSLTCSGAPANAACTLSSVPAVLADGASASFTATVTTETTTSSPMIQAPRVIRVGLILLAAPMLSVLKRRWKRFLVLFLLVSVPGFLAIGGCGGKSKASTGPTTALTSPGTYTMTVTATGAGGATASQKLTLTVN
jgi:hypothetical protein